MIQPIPPQSSMLGLCRWALRYAFGRWLALGAVLGTMVLQVGIDLIKPWPIVFLIDYVLGAAKPSALVRHVLDVLPGNQTQNTLIAWSVGATFVIFLLGWVVQLAGEYAQISFGQRIVYDLAGDLFSKLQQLSLRFHTSKSVGDNIRRVTSDCSCIATIVKDAILPMLCAAATLATMFFILWHIDSLLTGMALAVAPGMAFIFYLYARPMMECSYRQQEIEGKGYELVEQTFAAIPVVQAFTHETGNERRLKQNLEETLAAILSVTNVQLRFKVLMGLATAIGTAGVLWIGSRHAMEGTLSVGEIVLFLSYLVALYTPLESIMYTSSTIQSASGSARRVLEILNTATEIHDKAGAIVFPSIRGAVRFEDVTAGYEPGRPVLSRVSLEVGEGETVALVGATGAGKSTLAGMIPRFFDPWQGRVLIDGQDIRNIKLQSLRSQIGIVLQEPFLFPLSIAENIAYGRPDASRKEIETAAQAAMIHEFIMRLPKKYDTIIGGRGATVSGGERQRIAIARALLKNPRILILDEPTSALDTETESAFFQALRNEKKNRTVFLIAHRLSTVRYADRIVVLQSGQIFESGTHDQLLASGGVYASFCKLQG